MTRYDSIGQGYSKTRREDPRLRARLHAALANARTVVNVGAGTGAYEPRDRHVIAIEPSDVMAAQRPTDLAPAIRASAGNLPLRDRSVDAAMAVMSVHHWDEEREKGVRELRRVARGPVVILTYDATISRTMWLLADYLPEVAALDARIFPPPQQLAAWLGVRYESMSCRFHATHLIGCSVRSGLTRNACSTRAQEQRHRDLHACQLTL